MRNTTLGKNFKSQMSGSIVFYGKISDQGSTKKELKNIHLLREKYNELNRNVLKLKRTDFNSNQLTRVTVTASFMKRTHSDTSCRNISSINVTYETTRKTTYPPLLTGACIQAHNLRLRFQHTNDTEWFLCVEKKVLSDFCSFIPCPVHTNNHMQIASGILVVVCLLLILILTATCVRVQRIYLEIREHRPQLNPTTTIIQMSGQFWLVVTINKHNKNTHA